MGLIAANGENVAPKDAVNLPPQVGITLMFMDVSIAQLTATADIINANISIAAGKVFSDVAANMKGLRDEVLKQATRMVQVVPASALPSKS